MIRELFLRWFETATKNYWYRQIAKQLNSVEDAEKKLWCERRVLKSLVDEYNEIYGVELTIANYDLTDENDI